MHQQKQSHQQNKQNQSNNLTNNTTSNDTNITANITQNPQNPSTTLSAPPPPNRKYLFSLDYVLSIFALYFISLAVFGISRLCMQLSFVSAEVGLSDKLNLYKYGFLYDTRVVCIALFVYLALVYVLKPFKHLCQKPHILLRASSVYAFVLGFVCASFAIVNFYYYEMYKTKIDIFIFGLKDDNTKEILGIIFRDYPVGVLALCILLIAIFYAFVNSMILRKINMPLVRFSTFAVANLALICVLFIGARGSFGSFPLGEKDSAISTFASINALNPNPILAFTWAFSQYRADSDYFIADREAFEREFLSLQKEIFTIQRTSPKSDTKSAPKSTWQAASKALPKPHIIINLMESFGSGALSFDYAFMQDLWQNLEQNAQDNTQATQQNQTHKNPRLDLLGSLREHFLSATVFEKTSKNKTQQDFRQDFVFWRFFSSNTGTAPSFFDLYFLSPTINLSTGKMKKHKLAHTPLDTLEQNGYEVVFITSSSGSWVNITEYLKNQGIKVYDASFLGAKYQDADKHKNSFGINDEYIYKCIMEILQSASKPMAIFTLTTSNHPPFITPSEFDEVNAPNITAQVQEKFNKKAKPKKVLGSFLYSNNAFGEFLSVLKKSSVGKNTVVFATGDHHLRDLRAFPPRYNALNFAVPLYVYVPKQVQDSLKSAGRAIYYDPLRVGSHKDIFPSIFELFLDNAEYISLGGKNMLGSKNDKYEFGINAGIWASDEGIYYNGKLFRWRYGRDFGSLGELVETSFESEQISPKQASHEQVGQEQASLKQASPKQVSQRGQDFKHKYDRLNQMQFLWRINSAK